MLNHKQNYKDFYSFTKDFPLNTSGSESDSFGHTIVEYTMLKHTDVSNLSNVKGYVFILKQRLLIPNSTPYVPGSSTITSYSNYPAIIQNSVKLDINNDAVVRLANIFPRTLNSTVSTSSSSRQGDTNSVSYQHSSGSTTSNVNTFGVGLNLGFFGELPMGGISLNYSHSWIHGHSREDSSNRGHVLESDLSHSNAMSVKDWSAYSDLSKDNKSLTWIWGQSYPWDVILYNQSSSGDNVNLPDFVEDRLLNGDLLLPPSELALFGLDFTSHAVWLIDFPNGMSEDEVITVSHTTNKFTASHERSGATISAKLQGINEASTATYSSDKLDLSVYSLAPLEINPAEGIPTIGFNVNTFTYAPKKNTDNFKIVSPRNNLEAKGKGFDSIMTSSFKSNPVVNLYFKIEDNTFDYSLFIIHWLGSESGACALTWKINGKFTGSISLTQKQNSEGQENMDQISLRNLDHKSMNYHDYLVQGLNTVELTITPADKSNSHSYTLSSVSIR